MIPALPLRPRNRLAKLILAALRDARAREELAALARTPKSGPGRDWLDASQRGYAGVLRERAGQAFAALAALPLGGGGSLAEVLAEAAALYDAGLYFEVHELLEPWWRQAHGEAREALQGLVQVAVGYQHLANGNPGGARALLEEGSARLRGRALERLPLDAFASEVAHSLEGLPQADRIRVPRFPRRKED